MAPGRDHSSGGHLAGSGRGPGFPCERYVPIPSSPSSVSEITLATVSLTPPYAPSITDSRSEHPADDHTAMAIEMPADRRNPLNLLMPNS